MSAEQTRRPALRWLRYNLRTLLIAMLAAALLLWWFQPVRLDHRSFPIAVGDKWVYASVEGATQEDAVFEVIGVAQIAGRECFAVRRTIGGHAITFYVRVSREGVYRAGGGRPLRAAVPPVRLSQRRGGGLGVAGEDRQRAG